MVAVEARALGWQREQGADHPAPTPELESACLDALPFYVLLVDADHRIVFANRATREGLGVSLDRLVGGYCPTAIHGCTAPIPGCPLEEAVRTGQGVETELFDERTGRWLASAIFPTTLQTPAGRPIFLHVARDITTRKQTAEELARSLESQTILAEILRIALSDASLGELLAQVLKRITATPWLTVQARGAIFLVEDDPATLVLAAQHDLPCYSRAQCQRVPFGRCLCGRAAASRGTVFAADLDERHECRDESVAPHGHYCVPIVSHDRVLGVMCLYLQAGHARDPREETFLKAVADVLAGIIERRRAEERLRQLAAAVDQAAEAILITDDHGVIRYANPALERLSGRAPAALVGQRLRYPRDAQGDGELDRDRWATLGRGESWTRRVASRKPDGTLGHHDVTVSPVRDAAGQVVNYVAIERDRTEEERLHAQLFHSQKMDALGRLAGGVAHDFNNLLSVILSCAGFLQERLPVDAPAREDAEEIELAARRAAALTRQLLAFSRRDATRQETLHLDVVVRDTEKMLRRLIGEHLELVTSTRAGPGPITADRGQLEQVLVNLAVNARDAMPEGGTLTIATGEVELAPADPRLDRHLAPGRFVVLSVSDTGIGMPPEVLEHIFDPFFTTKDVGKGTGLGLSTVYGIVAQAGGCVRVASQPGAGSTFMILLPRAEEAADAQVDRPRSAALDDRRATVLVVEDEDAVRRLVCRVLEHQGLTVLQAPGGEQALALAAAHRGVIDLLLTDVIMGGMSGSRLAERLRAARGGVRVLFMSGHVDELLAAQGVGKDEAAFLRKPFTVNELAARVREALGATPHSGAESVPSSGPPPARGSARD